ncbi:MAG: MFS transporter [Dehalococcoidia bacterium]
MVGGERASEGGFSHRTLTLLVASVGGLLAPLNSTMIAVALPRIRDTFDIGITAATWLVTAYLICMAVAHPVAGRLGDTLGYRRVLMGGLGLFLVASLMAALATSFPMLLLFRLLQAVGASLVVPSGAALIRHAYPQASRATAFGVLGAAISLAAAAGPLLGGLLVALADWQAIFYVNVPIVALGLALAASLREAPLAPSRPQRSLAPWHLLGDFSLFRSQNFAAACGAVLFANMTMYTTLFATAFFLEEVQGRGASQAGPMMGALTAFTVGAAPVGGKVADKRGRTMPAVAGAVGLVLGVALLLPIHAGLPAWHIVLALSIVGLGIGLSSPAIRTAALESCPGEAAATAQGMYSMSRYVGSIIGIIIMGRGLGTDASRDYRLLTFVLLLAAVATLAAASLMRSRPLQTELRAGM